MTDESKEGTAWWHAQALCAGIDADLFFGERGDSTEEAKAVCRRCPVREPCLEYAMERNEPFGVWGGYSYRGRKNLRSKRHRAALRLVQAS